MIYVNVRPHADIFLGDGNKIHTIFILFVIIIMAQLYLAKASTCC